ncbi:hypothetical protein Forpe1208_v016439 [Fusarium oxysporum f. sp. rapae]|uniref:Uncharacterized protein n=1 Tax=Fusarium oxysporum f. sp. rapae TaxID=485398 RepID=A0A8J5TMU9_FUSOX|nr:hypothetical protein Forpe1208_v016439 [Fusarium oxysporum f. sp. rapae]
MPEQPDIPSTLEEFRNSEQVVDPPVVAVSSPIEPEIWPRYGNNCLVFFPTTNEDKIVPFHNHFKNTKPDDVGILYFLNIPVPDHGVPQPYNEEGPKAAERRAKDAKRLLEQNYPNYREHHRIGPTYIAVVESAYQIDGVDRPVDYATISIYDALTGKVVTAISKGVTLNPWFVEEARSQGFTNGNKNCGVMTPGAVLAKTIKGVDAQKWHEDACGKARREILDDAIKDMPMPQGKCKSS